jgi:hypothetical protein
MGWEGSVEEKMKKFDEGVKWIRCRRMGVGDMFYLGE